MRRLSEEPTPRVARSAGIVLRDYLYGAAETLRKRGKAGLRGPQWGDARRMILAADRADELIALLDRTLCDDMLFGDGPDAPISLVRPHDGAQGTENLSGDVTDVLHDDPPPQAA